MVASLTSLTAITLLAAGVLGAAAGLGADELAKRHVSAQCDTEPQPSIPRGAAPLAGAAAFVAIALAYGTCAETAELALFCCALLFLALTDLRARVIPNEALAFALTVRLVFLAGCFVAGVLDAGRLAYYALSALGVGFALLLVVMAADRLFGRESMGGGDLKLYAVAAFYFGAWNALVIVFLSCVFALIAQACSALARHVTHKPHKAADDLGSNPGALQRTMPFGPAIALACVAVMLVGPAGIL